jgi:stage II sporulation protein D
MWAQVKVASLIGLLLSLAFSTVSWAFDNPPIRVRLQTSETKIELEGLGVQIRGRLSEFEKVSIPQSQRIRIERTATGWQIQRSGHTEIIDTPYLAMKAISLRQNGKALPNQIFLSPQKSRQFDVIGILPLESYLVGVIASEMPLAWPVETLKAQAVAARSYALVTMNERAKSAFHVESTILDQVFSHIGDEDDNSPLVAKAKKAVQETEGIVLMNPQGKTLKAYYHSDCGGRTSNAKDVWGFGGSTGVAVDASCPTAGKHNWNLQVKATDLSVKLKTILKKDFGLLENFSLIRSNPEDRVQKMELLWASGVKTKISAHEFRAALGFDQLRSTFFEAKKSNDRFEFTGRGFGHGVGLCQWGARALGKQGQGYQEILGHYYPQARLQTPISSEGLQARSQQEPATQTR